MAKVDWDIVKKNVKSGLWIPRIYITTVRYLSNPLSFGSKRHSTYTEYEFNLINSFCLKEHTRIQGVDCGSKFGNLHQYRNFLCGKLDLKKTDFQIRKHRVSKSY